MEQRTLKGKGKKAIISWAGLTLKQGISAVSCSFRSIFKKERRALYLGGCARNSVDFWSRGGESGNLLRVISELKAYRQCQVHKAYDDPSGGSSYCCWC